MTSQVTRTKSQYNRNVRAVALSDQDANTFTLAIWLATELIHSQRLADHQERETE